MDHEWKSINVNSSIWNDTEFYFYQCKHCKTFMIDPVFPQEFYNKDLVKRFCSYVVNLGQAIFNETEEVSCAEIIMQQIIE